MSYVVRGSSGELVPSGGDPGRRGGSGSPGPVGHGSTAPFSGSYSGGGGTETDPRLEHPGATAYSPGSGGDLGDGGENRKRPYSRTSSTESLEVSTRIRVQQEKHTWHRETGEFHTAWVLRTVCSHFLSFPFFVCPKMRTISSVCGQSRKSCASRISFGSPSCWDFSDIPFGGRDKRISSNTHRQKFSCYPSRENVKTPHVGFLSVHSGSA